MARPRLHSALIPIFMTVLASCQTPRQAAIPRPVAIVEEPEEWRGIASAADAAAIDALPATWSQALADVLGARLTRRAAAEGPLLDPKAALARPAPAPGPYRCRMIRIGPATPRGRAWLAGSGFFCFVGVDRNRLSLTVEGGPERLGGYLWEEKESGRAVFLGGSGARRGPLAAYGDNPATNAVGILERIGDFHYRLALPSRGDSRLSVYELVAAPRE